MITLVFGQWDITKLDFCSQSRGSSSNARGGNRKPARGGRGGGNSQGRRNRSQGDLDKEMSDYMGGVSNINNIKPIT